MSGNIFIRIFDKVCYYRKSESRNLTHYKISNIFTQAYGTA